MKTAVVICPGRGVYNKTELGYLGRHHPEKAAIFSRFDSERIQNGQQTLAALDGAKAYSTSLHTRGDNASALIYASTFADFLAIDQDTIKIVAVTGNSLGWYSTLACGGALQPDLGFRVVNTMGTLMQKNLIGGQLIYPFMDENWIDQPDRKTRLLAMVEEINRRPGSFLSLSIDLGGMLVLAGNEFGLKAFAAAVPVVQERYPLRLANHAAFHSLLQAPVAEAGRDALSLSLFSQPKLPMIDGRGGIWWPGATNVEALRDYTLGHQVTSAYEFTKAIKVAAYEFAPDYFIITGPGTTLGGAVIQSLILAKWRGMNSKATFQTIQASEHIVVSMGLEEQRSLVAETGCC